MELKKSTENFLLVLQQSKDSKARGPDSFTALYCWYVYINLTMIGWQCFPLGWSCCCIWNEARFHQVSVSSYFTPRKTSYMTKRIKGSRRTWRHHSPSNPEVAGSNPQTDLLDWWAFLWFHFVGILAIFNKHFWRWFYTMENPSTLFHAFFLNWGRYSLMSCVGCYKRLWRISATWAYIDFSKWRVNTIW